MKIHKLLWIQMSHLREFMPLLKKYINFLKREFGDDLISVCLFGSIAKGDFKCGSDIDVLVVIKGLPLDIGYRIRRISHIKRKLKATEEYKALKNRNLPRLISEVIFTPEEIKKHPSILLDITIDGIILYDKDNFLKKELEN